MNGTGKVLPIIETIYPTTGFTPRSVAAIKPPLNSKSVNNEIINTINSLPYFGVYHLKKDFFISYF